MAINVKRNKRKNPAKANPSRTLLKFTSATVLCFSWYWFPTSLAAETQTVITSSGDINLANSLGFILSNFPNQDIVLQGSGLDGGNTINLGSSTFTPGIISINGATNSEDVTITGNAANTFTGTSLSLQDLNINANVNFTSQLNLFSNTGHTNTLTGNSLTANTLIKDGLGTYILDEANSNINSTIINSGTLQFGNGNYVGNIGSGAIIDNANLAFNTYYGPIISNSISGSGSLSQNGSGPLILTGQNSLSGTLSINAGSVQIGNYGSSGANTAVGDLAINSNSGISVINNSSLTTTGTVDTVLTAAITTDSSSQFIKAGSNTLILSGSNNLLDGTTVINGGTLQFGNGNSIGNIGSGAIYVNIGSTLIVDNSSSTIIQGAVTNNGTIFSSNGVLTFQDNVNGLGSFNGNIQFDANYNPSENTNIPALTNFNSGDVTFGTNSLLTMHIIGNGANQYDQMQHIHQLAFNGGLDLVFGANFSGYVGETFNLFDFTNFSGSFDPSKIIVSGIDSNLLDFSTLAVDGKLELKTNVSQVPVPATAWLFGSGLLLLAGSRRRSWLN